MHWDSLFELVWWEQVIHSVSTIYILYLLYSRSHHSWQKSEKNFFQHIPTISSEISMFIMFLIRSEKTSPHLFNSYLKLPINIWIFYGACTTKDSTRSEKNNHRSALKNVSICKMGRKETKPTDNNKRTRKKRTTRKITEIGKEKTKWRKIGTTQEKKKRRTRKSREIFFKYFRGEEFLKSHTKIPTHIYQAVVICYAQLRRILIKKAMILTIAGIFQCLYLNFR